jgi:hypothetical protein
MTRALDRYVQAALWLPDGKSLLLAGDDGVRRAPGELQVCRNWRLVDSLATSAKPRHRCLAQR